MKLRKHLWTVITRRELASYFSSVMAYIAGAIFLLCSGILFFSTFFLMNRASLRAFFELLPILYSFFIPALTMRVFSEENKSGTMETLATLPVKPFDIVLGKYAAALLASVALLAPTLFYVLACAIFAENAIDAGPVAGGYAGAVLLAAAFSAVGIFASSISRNQIVAFFISFAICAGLTFISTFAILLPGPFVPLANFISASSRFLSISRGIIDSRDILYFVSVAAVFVALSQNQIQNSRRG